MRYLLQISLLFIAVVLAASFAQAQVCEGDIELRTQAQVDVFNCVEVTGGLYIGPIYVNQTTDITNLDGLSELTRATTVTIIRNDNLVSLEGLGSLAILEGGIRIDQNNSLTSLNGLSAIDRIGPPPPNNDGTQGYIVIDSNNSLTDLSALSEVSEDVGSLSITYNNALNSLGGLNNIVYDQLRITGNPSLKSLSGLSTLGSGDLS